MNPEDRFRLRLDSTVSGRVGMDVGKSEILDYDERFRLTFLRVLDLEILENVIPDY